MLGHSNIIPAKSRAVIDPYLLYSTWGVFDFVDAGNVIKDNNNYVQVVRDIRPWFYPYDINLITDGEFAIGVGDWTAANGISEWGPLDKYLRFTHDNTTNVGTITYNVRNYTLNNLYKVTFLARSPNTTTTMPAPTFNTGSTFTKNPSLTTNWQAYEFYGYTTLSSNIVINFPSVANSIVEIDSISIVKDIGLTLYQFTDTKYPLWNGVCTTFDGSNDNITRKSSIPSMILYSIAKKIGTDNDFVFHSDLTGIGSFSVNTLRLGSNATTTFYNVQFKGAVAIPTNFSAEKLLTIEVWLKEKYNVAID